MKGDQRAIWQIRQGAACSCLGFDDMCPCQNIEAGARVEPAEATPGITDEELLRRAVTYARKGRRLEYRWVHVMHVFGLGSSYARGLCMRFDLDPEEKVR